MKLVVLMMAVVMAMAMSCFLWPRGNKRDYTCKVMFQPILGFCYCTTEGVIWMITYGRLAAWLDNWRRERTVNMIFGYST
ncbi:hypothetical protein QBC32DRAFT_349603 [Pseudoneurospora amorphoporcata]|uniref:Uncharacterized protein n=1 Tax=Pseudoneurospora amorphoporcata TaxID=241081 RepID=A0AAN6SDK1_9PEZI|nr:hypothetical protein QBC32DRAFT_349603 [Pseudoneurospora amorphoporcata]